MKKMKKLLAVLTAGVMCAGMTAGAYVTAQEFPAVSDAAESTVMVQDDGETKVEGDFSYRVQEDGTIEILKYLGTSGVVKVPDTVEGMEVTRIGDEAFCYSTVETITIPDSITSFNSTSRSNSFPSSQSFRLQNASTYFCLFSCICACTNSVIAENLSTSYTFPSIVTLIFSITPTPFTHIYKIENGTPTSAIPISTSIQYPFRYSYMICINICSKP